MNNIRVVLSIMFLMLCLVSYADVILVPDDYETIQGAISASIDGDTVLVAPGIYSETIRFNGKSIVLATYYLITDNEDYISATTIEGSNNPNTSVVSIRDNEGPGTQLIGFTIANGNADYGGGIYIGRSSRALIRNVIVEHNTAERFGGGIYCTGNSIVTIHNSIVKNNVGAIGTAGISLFDYADVMLEDVRVIDNNTLDGNIGGVSSASQAQLLIRNCLIEGNSPGALASTSYQDVSVVNTSIRNNSSEVGGTYRGIIVLYNGRIDFYNTEISNNSSEHNLLYVFDGEFSFNNVTIADNDIKGEMFYIFTVDPIIFRNSILLGYRGEPLTASYSTQNFNVSYSVVQGEEEAFPANRLTWGEGNFYANPRFVDRANGDYSLRSDSPLINVGDPEQEADPDGSRSDIGAYYYHNIMPISGFVHRENDNAPIAGAKLITSYGDVAHTNEEGYYELSVYRSGEFTLQVSANGYFDKTFEDLSIDIGESIELDIILQYPEILPSLEEISLSNQYGDELNPISLSFTNVGTGDFEWRASINILDESELPFSLVKEIPLTDYINDTEIHGAVVVGEQIFVVGKDELSEIPQIYILTEDSRYGYIVSRRNQPESALPNGLSDLDYDGELVWGAAGNFVIGFDLNGEVVTEFIVEQSPVQRITYDSSEQILWVSSESSNIYGYTRQGEFTQRTILIQDYQNLGMSYLPIDRDGYNLYMIDNYEERYLFPVLMKVNTANGDVMSVYDFQIFNRLNGLQISNGYLKDWVMLTVEDRVDSRYLNVYQLEEKHHWVTVEPTEGNLEEDEEATVTLSFDFQAIDRFGYEHSAELTISNIVLGETIVPITIEVLPNSVEEKEIGLPNEFSLSSAFPNPFNSSARIGYALPYSSHVTIAIYDITGRKVDVLLSKEVSAGNHFVHWNAENFAAGVYFCRMEAGEFTSTVKLLLIK